jgi:mannose-6-phosphate isomerase
MSSPTSSSQFDAYPLTFEPQFEERVWGGRGLEDFGKILPSSVRIGESWEISDVDGKQSKVSRGVYKGLSLRELVAIDSEAVLGRSAGNSAETRPRFPLLLKLIEARHDLSVQVHPSNEDLRRQGQSGNGKTEAWVILATEPGARVVFGLEPGVDRADLLDRMEALAGGKLPRQEEESLFHWVEVAPGDVIFVPAGTIHSSGKGIVFAEVQQTSDITYRIYDWGRPGLDGAPRTLHLREARDVADPGPVACPSASVARAGQGVIVSEGFASVLTCDEFQIDLLASERESGTEVKGSTGPGSTEGFHILSVVEGKASCRVPSGDELEISPGEFVLLPAALGEYSIESGPLSMKMLRFRGPR